MLLVLCFILVPDAVFGDWVEISQNSKYERNFNLPTTTTTTEFTTAAFANETFEYFEDEDDDENVDEVNTLGFLPFVEMIQNSLLATENRSIKQKTLFLKNLRDNLLVNIERRMQTLWHKNGEAREYKEEHYHMDFPSNEGALMTIGFLTFAVFLIKLVLKLIHALKTKYNNYYDNSDSGTTTTYFGRKKRSLEEAMKILQLIEEYKVF